MAKVTWKPGTMLYPVPAAMISCRHDGIDNIITISWIGTICSNPPMVSISVRPSRFSYDMIKNSGEFIINIPGKELAFAADFCGVKSGKDIDKFAYLKLEKQKASIVDVPMIEQSAVAIECKVKEIVKLGSHDMFIADVVAVNVDEKYLDEMDRLNLDSAELICYNHGKYCVAGEPLGKFGFSVEKPKTKANKKKGHSSRETGKSVKGSSIVAKPVAIKSAKGKSTTGSNAVAGPNGEKVTNGKVKR